MGDDDIQSENGRFHGSTSVQHHCGLLGAWNRGGFWDDNAESVRVQMICEERERIADQFDDLQDIKVCHKRYGASWSSKPWELINY